MLLLLAVLLGGGDTVHEIPLEVKLVAARELTGRVEPERDFTCRFGQQGARRIVGVIADVRGARGVQTRCRRGDAVEQVERVGHRLVLCPMLLRRGRDAVPCVVLEVRLVAHLRFAHVLDAQDVTLTVAVHDHAVDDLAGAILVDASLEASERVVDGLARGAVGEGDGVEQAALAVADVAREPLDADHATELVVLALENPAIGELDLGGAIEVVERDLGLHVDRIPEAAPLEDDTLTRVIADAIRALTEQRRVGHHRQSVRGVGTFDKLTIIRHRVIVVADQRPVLVRRVPEFDAAVAAIVCVVRGHTARIRHRGDVACVIVGERGLARGGVAHSRHAPCEVDDELVAVALRVGVAREAACLVVVQLGHGRFTACQRALERDRAAKAIEVSDKRGVEVWTLWIEILEVVLDLFERRI